jgi:pimeloyl-ACP methyl ester carboxylesterase
MNTSSQPQLFLPDWSLDAVIRPGQMPAWEGRDSLGDIDWSRPRLSALWFLCNLSQLSYSATQESLDLRLARAGLPPSELWLQRGSQNAYGIRCHGARILIFQGSTGLECLRFDLQCKAALDAASGLRVHGGFLGAWKLLEAEVLEWAAADSSLPLISAGHSLGGALAALAALRLPQNHRFSVGFGAPRLVVAADAARYAAPYFRLRNHNDPVANLPPPWMGFDHIGKELWLGPDLRLKAGEGETFWSSLGEELRHPFRAWRHGWNASPLRCLSDHAPLNMARGLMGSLREMGDREI